MTPPTVMQIKRLDYPLTIFNRRLEEKKALSLETSMALANSLLCSSSSFSQIHYRYRDFNYAPQIFSQPEPSSLAFSPIRNKFSELGNGMSGFSKKKNIVHASANDLNASASSTSLDAGSVPIPVVLIDQDSDSDATIVQLSFGDRLGALINTVKVICVHIETRVGMHRNSSRRCAVIVSMMEYILRQAHCVLLVSSIQGILRGGLHVMNALKDLGLDVAKGTVLTEGPVKQTKFFITRLHSGRKVEDPDMLERIRLTIINNLLKYHPESSERLAMGEAFGIKAPEKKVPLYPSLCVCACACDSKLVKHLLCIETADRPGLLVEIIKVIADVNIDVESAEIDTEVSLSLSPSILVLLSLSSILHILVISQGLIAKDKFHVSYRGASLNSSLSQEHARVFTKSDYFKIVYFMFYAPSTTLFLDFLKLQGLVNCLRYYLGRPETDTDSY
ncbi:hypothetical protein DKX38_012134 [Salix brachista]|uniref:ACT domain-containing protein ACR n=1 Tax=Salix brachista TaxID=2182728 RepID=A0A5N5LN33_9ROSI|nr:hypothetical protein DKX38_012134 [Salix brachista]